jgi:hypothetical protein
MSLGARIDTPEVDVEGTIDLSGFFGVRPVQPCPSEVRLHL